MPSGSILLEYTKICSPRWRTRCDFRKIYLHCHLLYYLISISNFKNGFLEVLDINSLLITAFLLELWFPSVITGFPLFTLSPSFYFFNGFPCIFFYFSASSYCFWITLILLGWISNIPSPGSYFFFIFDFLYITKFQPSSKLILHSFKVCFSQAPYFCVRTLPTDLHQQFKPDDIMIASLVLFYSNLIYHACILSEDKV